MKHYLIICLLYHFTQGLLAFDFSFKNGKIDYSSNSGVANFEELAIYEKTFDFEINDFETTIEKFEESVEFSFLNTKLRLKDSLYETFSSYNRIYLDFDGLSSNEKNLSINATALLLDGEQYFEFSRLEGQCDGLTEKEDPYQFINLCLNDGMLAVGEGKFTKTEMFPKMFELMGRPLQTKIGDISKFTNFFMTIESGKVHAKLKVRQGIEVKVNIEAQADFNKQDKLLRIHLQKAKASFFSIKKKILDELRQNQSEKFWVENDFIYMKL